MLGDVLKVLRGNLARLALNPDSVQDSRALAGRRLVTVAPFQIVKEGSVSHQVSLQVTPWRMGLSSRLVSSFTMSTVSAGLALSRTFMPDVPDQLPHTRRLTAHTKRQLRNSLSAAQAFGHNASRATLLADEQRVLCIG